MNVYPDSIKFYVMFSTSIWTDVSSKVVGTTKSKYGMSGNKSLDRVANTGTLKFTLNNESGIYSPDSTLMKSGLPVKLTITFENTTFIKFYGKIDNITIGVNLGDMKTVILDCVDWLDYAANHPMVSPAVASNKRGDDALDTILLDMPINPLATSLAVGDNIFNAVFDGVTTTTRAYTEMARIALSEVGYIYLRRDNVYGETLVFESNSTRNGLTEVEKHTKSISETGDLLNEDGSFLLLETGDLIILDDVDYAIFSNMQSLDIEYGQDVINRFTATAYPKKIDTSAQILYSLPFSTLVGAGQTISFRGNYSDPIGGSTVSGKNMISPISTTDYLMNTASDGSGSDITAYMTITATYGSEGASYVITNTNSSIGYITKLQARGIGIYAYNPIDHAEENQTSINEYGYKTETLQQKYQTDLYAGTQAITKFLERDKEPRKDVKTVSFLANTNASLMLAYLKIDIGTLVQLTESVSGVNSYYYIQGVEFTIEQGGIVKFTWIVREALSLLLGLSLLPVQFAGNTGLEGIDFGYLPQISNINVRSESFWVNHQPSGVFGAIMGTFSDAAGYLIYEAGGGIVLYQKGVTSPGAWNCDTPLTDNTWVHVVVTRDSSNPANQPKFYINGILAHTNEVFTQLDANANETGSHFFVGNVKTPAKDWSYPFKGSIHNVRVYTNYILTQNDVTALYNAGKDDTTTVINPLYLKFCGLCVPTAKVGNYSFPLTKDMNLTDNIYGVIGKPNAPTPPVVGNTSTSSVASVGTMTWNHTIGAGNDRLLVVSIQTRASEPVASITYGSASLYKLGGVQLSTGNNPRSEIWYLVSPPTGTDVVTVSFPAVAFAEGTSFNVSNVNLASPFQTFTYGWGTRTSGSVAVVSNSSELVIDSLSTIGIGLTVNVGAGQTQISNLTSDANWRGATSYEVGSASNVMSWTLGSSVGWALMAASINGA
jgi:hypothetical protein